MRILKNKNFIIIFIIIVIAIILYLLIQNWEESNFEDNIIISDEKEKEEVSSEENKESNNTTKDEEIQDDSEIEKNKIYIYVTGEVINRGIVILDEGSRISDAIDAAGGITDKADISKMNLVYLLEDGMKVTIPSIEELNQNEDFEYITKDSGNNSIDSKESYLNGNILSSKSNSSKSDIVNINTATQTELETLPGIGPSLALKIINYRNENGKFTCIEDIKNVNGIGESKFENIKNYIKV